MGTIEAQHLDTRGLERADSFRPTTGHQIVQEPGMTPSPSTGELFATLDQVVNDGWERIKRGRFFTHVLGNLAGSRKAAVPLEVSAGRPEEVYGCPG
jgi:hypothetical protein